eukprot:TRINITY_DN436_c0_g1_i3.p1 TRINITY_DN436_c0_g1~~TRINITY_DN436_c0_g1_i3.p1  ORF type:complete len:146 (+),score=6.09 TRINITY_DN436_c0_g1_i3:235-672(+)
MAASPTGEGRRLSLPRTVEEDLEIAPEVTDPPSASVTEIESLEVSLDLGDAISYELTPDVTRKPLSAECAQTVDLLLAGASALGAVEMSGGAALIMMYAILNATEEPKPQERSHPSGPHMAAGLFSGQKPTWRPRPVETSRHGSA